MHLEYITDIICIWKGISDYIVSIQVVVFSIVEELTNEEIYIRCEIC